MFGAALILFAEEVVWEFLKRMMAALGRWPLIRSAEALIMRLPPYAAATAFLLPGILLLPVKIGALWLIAHDEAVLGCVVIVAAKLAGTALVSRIFTLTRPALMSLSWFARLYAVVMRWRERLYGYVKASAAWHSLQRARARMRQFFAHLKPGRFALRLRALKRLRKRAATR